VRFVTTCFGDSAGGKGLRFPGVRDLVLVEMLFPVPAITHLDNPHFRLPWKAQLPIKFGDRFSRHRIASEDLRGLSNALGCDTTNVNFSHVRAARLALTTRGRNFVPQTNLGVIYNLRDEYKSPRSKKVWTFGRTNRNPVVIKRHRAFKFCKQTSGLTPFSWIFERSLPCPGHLNLSKKCNKIIRKSWKEF
jgi:hypothetical protein